MKILTVVGARPQFIKSKMVSQEIRKDHEEILVHTGQHYDWCLSQQFFDELEIPAPDVNLGVGAGSPAWQTGQILIKMEDVLKKYSPDLVMVYGDTTSTLAGALAAAKNNIPVAHVEAGMRSYDKSMPEEQNRVLTDHISDLLFAPCESAVISLEDENIEENVYNSGDVMVDATHEYLDKALKESKYRHFMPKQFTLATIHRAENTDDWVKLREIIAALLEIDNVVLPLHPRTKKRLIESRLYDDFYLTSYDEVDSIVPGEKMVIINPVGYLDMLALEYNAKQIITDSGGVQKEAYVLGVPCITVRKSTEWVETLEYGWNMLVPPRKEEIVEAARMFDPIRSKLIEGEIISMIRTLCGEGTEIKPDFLGKGDASKKIASILTEWSEDRGL